MTGFNKVMRFCNTLQEYQSAKNQGKITDDLFVVILQDKLAKFKGQTFDWSENADLTALATKGELTNLRNEVIDNEEVAALAITELKEKIDAVNRNISGALVTKNELNSAIDSLTSTIDDNKSACVSSINELDERKADKKYVEDTLSSIDLTALATKGELTNLQNEVIANEKVHAAAYNDLNERINNIGGGSAGGSGTLRVWINEAAGLEMTQEQIDENIASYNAIQNGATFFQLLGGTGQAVNFFLCVGFSLFEDSIVFIVPIDNLSTTTGIILNADGSVIFEGDDN